MDAKIAGFIEESHYDEGGRRVIDKFKIEHISLVPDENGNYIMPPYTHVRGLGAGVEIEICDPEFRLLIEDEVEEIVLMDAYTKELMEDGTLDAVKKFVKGELNQENRMVNELFAEFEQLIDRSSPDTLWVETLYWAYDDWIDWLSGR